MLYNLLKYSYCLHIFHIKAQVDKNKLSYTEKQDKTGRPVSPHVTIYKFPVTALSSITNRVTGVGIIILLLCWYSIYFILMLYCFIALTAGITGIGVVSLLNGDAPLLMQGI